MTVTQRVRWSDTDQKAIREQLDRILHSVPFQHSPRRQKFLEFIVSETLAGRTVKGYDVALEVFDRLETFDAAVDPVVRVEAGRLRDKLREYYSTDGEGDPIHIDLPKGTYTPQIKFRHEDAPQIRPQKGRPELSSTVPSVAVLRLTI